MLKVRYGSYGKFSGPYIKGDVDAMHKPYLDDTHWMRVLWLTTMVESGGKTGSIMMADGTGCTAGVEQSIIVYPRNLTVQGPLVKLLWLLDHVIPLHYYAIGELFDRHRWVIAGDKKIRDADDGSIIRPADLREALTPNQGRVPRSGPQWEQSKEWAQAFCEIFSRKDTRDAQIKHAMDGFTKFARRVEHKKLDHVSIEDAVYGGNAMKPPFEDSIEGWTNDLAMALFWERKTNGPAPALTRLGRAVKRFEPQDPAFGRFLIQQLSTAKYGRWATNRNRRARKFAQMVWPKELFTGPKPVWPRIF